MQETEWDRYIDQQEQILNNLYDEYELVLNERLDDTNFLLQQVVDGINGASGALGSDGAIASALGSDGAIASALGAEGTLASALGVEGAIASAIVNAVGENGSVKKILNTEVSAVGTTLSTAMNNIWSVGEGNAKSVLTTYGQGFQDKQTITNDVLGNIKADVAAMVDDVDKDAQKKVETNKTQPSTKADPTKDNKKEEPKKEKPKKTSGDGKPKVGDKVKFVSGQYYYDSQGKKPLGYHNRGKEVYITSINTKSWATHPYHISTGNKLGKGDLGWLKLNQISGYATGKKDFANDEWAWTQEGGKEEYIIRPSDGAILTPIARRGSVLNAEASNNLWNMTNNPAEFIKNNLGLDNANVPNGANVNNTYSQHIDNVVFRMDNVKNYDEMLSAMQKDKSFEKLILSMSINRLAGKSSLAKGKSIR